MTSHDAVSHVRRVFHTKRVGHTGTLDPAASGVLPICVGQATRLVEVLQAGTKEYLAEATFGYETDTLDAVGQTVRQCDAQNLTVESLEAACARFRGEIWQQPPLHSAIKIGGQKLYDIARAGGDIEIPARRITISALEVTRFFPGTRPRAYLRIECSGGTYIRSLVRDIGRALENAATMTFLSRVRSGNFALSETVTPQELEDSSLLILTPLPDVLRKLHGAPHRNDASVNALWQGKIIHADERITGEQLSEFALWSNEEETLFALAQHQSHGQWKPVKVFDLRV